MKGDVTERTHIYFWEGESKPKTRTWFVYAKNGNLAIGQIFWLGKWMTYVFEPFSETVYEKTCLREIADFLEEQTKLQRQGWKKRVS